MHKPTPVSTQTVPDFDPGPLSWVQGEIGQALERGLDLLAVFRATPADPAALRIGGEVELVLEALCRTAEGDDLISWKFRPL